MDIKERLSVLGITPNKALGQNFLSDDLQIAVIIGAADVACKNVLEIGPGLGSLTIDLNRIAKKLLAVELDKSMVNALQTMHDCFENPESLEIMNADFLKVDDSVLYEKLGDGFCVVANLPYYITTPVCMKLLQSGLFIESMTLMMQKEAAARFTAKCSTKQYSPLTVLANYLYDITEVTELSPQCYYPQPDVSSVVLHLRSKGSDLSVVKSLSRILKITFSARRKTVQNNLSMSGLDKENALYVLENAGIDPKCRAEQLEICDFLRLERALHDVKNSQI